MREKTLLLGNGLNRTLENSLSWSELMKRLGSVADEEEQIPFPIDFGQIAATKGGTVGNRARDAYKQLREDMSNIVTRLDQESAGDAHRPELLFTTDVAIVGLELDYSEIDLWWLLAQRAAIFSTYNNLRSYENEITYYYVSIASNEESPIRRGRLHALQALGVNIRGISAKDYPSGYAEIAQAVGESWAKL